MRADVIKWFAGLTVEEASQAIIGSGKREHYTELLSQSVKDYGQFVDSILKAVNKDLNGLYTGAVWIMEDECNGAFEIGEEVTIEHIGGEEFRVGPMTTCGSTLKTIARRKE